MIDSGVSLSGVFNSLNVDSTGNVTKDEWLAGGGDEASFSKYAKNGEISQKSFTSQIYEDFVDMPKIDDVKGVFDLSDQNA